MGRDSAVDIVTGYGLDSPGIEFRRRRGFPHLSRPALGSTQLFIQWVTGLPGLKRLGRDVHHPLPSSAEVKKVQRYISTPSLGLYGLF